MVCSESLLVCTQTQEDVTFLTLPPRHFPFGFTADVWHIITEGCYSMFSFDLLEIRWHLAKLRLKLCLCLSLNECNWGPWQERSQRCDRNPDWKTSKQPFIIRQLFSYSKNSNFTDLTWNWDVWNGPIIHYRCVELVLQEWFNNCSFHGL